jgi:nucleotide-binding universal stress UspA family protein
MRILVAVDKNSYSAHIVGEAARLASNTWADVSILGILAKNTLKGKARDNETEAVNSLSETLFAYRDNFLGFFKGEDCPYARHDQGSKLEEIRKGLWEGKWGSGGAKKDLSLRLRTGDPAREILAEANEQESDIIILGCDSTNDCAWKNEAGVPRKVANNASCSVLVVKKEEKVKRIVCCLDHDRTTQESLEMINQMVTLYGARLTIVGLTENENLKPDVEKKLDNILRYYLARNIEPWIELVEISSLDSYIAREAQRRLMALWMGKKSIIEKVLSKSKVNRLIKGSESSVLILR